MSIAKKLMTTGAKEPAYVDDVFSTYLYEGNGSTQTINNGIDLAGEGGMVWIKSRGSATFGDHRIYDTERGATYSLASNQTWDNTQLTTGLTSFNSSGFTHGSQDRGNQSGIDYASWTFRKAPKFFDVVTYTGDGDPYRQVPHGLGAKAGMVAVKRIDSTSDWVVTHVGWEQPNGGINGILRLNSSDAKVDGGPTQYLTDTTFSVVGDNTAQGIPNDRYTNIAGGDYVAYLFAHDDSDESMIKCGSYTGNGNVDGPEIDLGFEPQFLMVKAASSSGPWTMVDVMRGINTTSNGESMVLRANEAIEEQAVESFTVNSRGFSTFSTNSAYNASGAEYIYMAIRRPNKPAEEFEPEELFEAVSYAGDDTSDRLISNLGFEVDLSILTRRDNDPNFVFSRLLGQQELKTESAEAESTRTGFGFDTNEGIIIPSGADINGTNSSSVPYNYISWMFRRAPGFFDVVCYEGDGQAGREVPHNLGVAPEMIWFKGRDQNRNWAVYAKPAGYIEIGQLNRVNKFETSGVLDSTPTNDSIVLGNSGNSNWSGWSYIAYLFASVPGISKVGSYTGTGNDLDVNCGFTTGARFVLIKRTDSTGDWYVWDSVRGITVGNDPYLLLNTTDAEVTNTDYIDPLSSGFRVTASAPDAINAANGKYIYMSIA